jgi:cbb3-type cytochrome oxidase maturation protein
MENEEAPDMSVVYVLVPFALLMGLGFVALFVWNARSGQYEDLVTPAVRILMDDHTKGEKHE